jgi:hypothetical protein
MIELVKTVCEWQGHVIQSDLNVVSADPIAITNVLLTILISTGQRPVDEKQMRYDEEHQDMNIAQLITAVENGDFRLSNEPESPGRSKLYIEVVGQLDDIRTALGLPLVDCNGCGHAGLNDCEDCGLEYCGRCGEQTDDGFVCQGCVELRLATDRMAGPSPDCLAVLLSACPTHGPEASIPDRGLGDVRPLEAA